MRHAATQGQKERGQKAKVAECRKESQIPHGSDATEKAPQTRHSWHFEAEKSAKVAGVAGGVPETAKFADPKVAKVAGVAGGPLGNAKFADLEDLYFEIEERAALVADGCDISQAEATERAAREYGFATAKEFYAVIGQKIGRRAA